MVLLGNLFADPEMRYTPSGQAVCNFRMAVNLRVPDGSGGWTTAPMAVRVTAWGKTAEVCNQYLKKGSQVLVESDRMDFDHATGGPRIWKRQDGTPGTSFEATARIIRFTGRSGREETHISEASSEEEIVFS